jgi:hypothetical protein
MEVSVTYLVFAETVCRFICQSRHSLVMVMTDLGQGQKMED